MDFLPEGLLITDAEGVIKATNIKMCELLETSETKIKGRTVEEAGLLTIKNAIAFSRKTETPYRGLIEKIKGKITGSEKTLEVSVSPVLKGERIDDFIITCRDMTWFMKMAEEEKGEFGLKMMEDSIRTLTHELRTHIMAIQGAIEVLETSGHQDIEMLEIIRKEVNKIKKLIDIFHPLTHPIPRKEEVDINILCEESIKRFKVELRKKGISVNREYLPSIPHIHIDPYLVSRAIDNLIKNSIEAIESGNITIKTTVDMEYDIFPDKKAVIITIRDSGNGLPEEVKKRLFLPVMSQKKGEAGFGLYIAKKMVSLNDGIIRYVENENKWHFEIAFPVK